MLIEYADDLAIEIDSEARYPGLKCVTPGNPYILHCFSSFSTEPTDEHKLHLDKIAKQIEMSLGGSRPINRVLITGHSSTWKGTTKAKLDQRATERAGLIATELVIRLGTAADAVTVLYEGRSDRETWTPYSATSTSKSAQRARALNRRVEIHFFRKSPPKPDPVPKPKPITPSEMKATIYFFLGRKPKSKARDTLLNDLKKFVPAFAKMLSSDARIPWLSLAKAYVNILKQEFGSDHRAGFWFLVGSAYTAVDAKPRRLKLDGMIGVPFADGSDRMKYRRAFRDGYTGFRKIQSRVAETGAGKAALEHLRARVAATPRKWTLALAAYRAFRELYLEDNPTARFVRIMDTPRFRYPKLGIRR